MWRKDSIDAAKNVAENDRIDAADEIIMIRLRCSSSPELPRMVRDT